MSDPRGGMLVVTSSWPRTEDEQAGTFVRTDAIARAAEGDRVVVAAPTGPGTARGGPGLEVVDVPHGGLYGSPGAAHRGLLAPWRLFGLVSHTRAIGRLIDRYAPSTIVAHWLVPAGMVIDIVMRRRASVPIELVAHGADVRFLSALPAPVARRLLERITRGATIVRVVSEALADRLLAIAPFLQPRVCVAAMPLAAWCADRRCSGVRTVGASRVRPIHVVASRLVESKGIERAIDHVAQSGGSLIVVGDGPMRARLVAHARFRRVIAEFVGARPHEETLSWIAGADVVLAPLARHEGAPTVVREAESLGRPVVCFPG